MKQTLLLTFAITACLLTQAFAQTYSPIYPTKIVFKNGNKLTILPPPFASDFSMTLPDANASGVLTNDGLGGLSWAAAGGDLSPALILAPTTSTRNVVQPTLASVVPLTVKGFAGQSANLQEWQNSAGGVLASVSPSGAGYFNGGLTAYFGANLNGQTNLFASAGNSSTLLV